MNAHQPADADTSEEQPEDGGTLPAAETQATTSDSTSTVGRITTGSVDVQGGNADAITPLPGPEYDDGYEPI